jgi:hypothetical protein
VSRQLNSRRLGRQTVRTAASWDGKRNPAFLAEALVLIGGVRGGEREARIGGLFGFMSTFGRSSTTARA